MVSARGDCRSFQTSACSRPPLPRTRTFIARETRLGAKGNACQTGGGVIRIEGILLHPSETPNPGPHSLRRRAVDKKSEIERQETDGRDALANKWRSL